MILLEETITFEIIEILKEKLNGELRTVIEKLNKFYKAKGSEITASEITVGENDYFAYTLEEKVTDSNIRIIVLPSRKAIGGLKQTLSASEFPVEVFICYDYSYGEENRYLIPERIREAAIRALKTGLEQRGFRDYYLTDTGEADAIDNKNNRTTVTHFQITIAG